MILQYNVRMHPDSPMFLRKLWHFQMAASCLLLGVFTPNLWILESLVCSLWLCESIVANPIIYRLVLSPSRYETRQCTCIINLVYEPSSTKEQREMTTFWVFYRTWPTKANFLVFNFLLAGVTYLRSSKVIKLQKCYRALAWARVKWCLLRTLRCEAKCCCNEIIHFSM